MVREALVAYMAADGLEVVGEAGTPAEALRAVDETRPDVLVTAWDLPGSVIELLDGVTARSAGTNVLVVSAHEDLPTVVRAMRSGARGYVVKTASVQELVDAIRRVAAGAVHLSPAWSGQVLAQLVDGRPSGIDSLSDREFEVLRLFGTGLTLTECALQLHVSVSTASTYRARLLGKLGLRSTHELVRYAVQHGISGSGSGSVR